MITKDGYIKQVSEINDKILHKSFNIKKLIYVTCCICNEEFIDEDGVCLFENEFAALDVIEKNNWEAKGENAYCPDCKNNN